MLPVGFELVAKVAASIDREGQHDVGARVGADCQPVRLAVTGDELTPMAAIAQMRVARRRTVFDIQFAHDNFVSNPEVPEGFSLVLGEHIVGKELGQGTNDGGLCVAL